MTPAQAYEFARGADMPIQPFDATGKPLRHLRLARPLDFLAVSDHAEFFGEMAICENPADPGYGSPECLAYRFDIVLRGRRQTLFENKLQGS